MIKNLKQKLGRHPSVQKIRRLHSLSKSNLDLHYKVEDLNEDYHQVAKELGDKEIEHQIGRLKNFKKIVSEMKQNNIKGDIIEFGTWQGFSLLWLSYFIERQALFSKKIIGIDSFEGLPNTKGIFAKGAFSDTSKAECENNLKQSPYLYGVTKRNIFIEDSSFSKTESILLKVKEITQNKFCLSISIATYQVLSMRFIPYSKTVT